METLKTKKVSMVLQFFNEGFLSFVSTGLFCIGKYRAKLCIFVDGIAINVSQSP
tara:strand:- start:261 stop:422 length:162 start_codon:yes stop_codon:yes gene_type:complete